MEELEQLKGKPFMFGGRGRRGGCCAERKASACRFTSKTSVLSHLLTSLEIETEFPVFEEMSQEVLDFLSSRAFFFDRLSPTSIVDGRCSVPRRSISAPLPRDPRWAAPTLDPSLKRGAIVLDRP